MIRKDPTVTHQPVEGLRIALGLSTGQNQLTIVLLGQARVLVTDELDSTIHDLDTLEKYLPTIQELQLPIVVPEENDQAFEFDPDFSIQEQSMWQIRSLIHDADRVLIF